MARGGRRLRVGAGSGPRLRQRRRHRLARRLSATWHERVAFGLHHDLHASRDDTELGRELTPELLRAELERIRPDWVQCDCKGVYGYTCYPTEVGYAAPGIVRDALQIYRDVTRDLGIPLVAHVSGVWDEVAVEGHPDWARVDAEGRPDPRRVCVRSAYGSELLLPLMLEVLDRYDVEGLWVDVDVWWADPCWCDRCRTAFGAEPPRRPDEPGWDEWHAFQRRSYESYARTYMDAVHEHRPECLISLNWGYSSFQPEAVGLPVDWLSGDYTDLDGVPGVEQTAWEGRVFAGRGLPWHMMPWPFLSAEKVNFVDFTAWETKTLAHLLRESAEIVANGGAVSVYSQPERSGRMIEFEHDLIEGVGVFCREREDVSLGSVSVPQAAVVHLSPAVYGHPDKLGRQPLYGRPRGQPSRGPEGALFALLDVGVHADVLCEDDLLERLRAYPLVVLAEQAVLPDGLAEALTAYVEAGGRLLLTGAELGPLARLAGVEATGEAAERAAFLPVDGTRVAVLGGWRPVRAVDAEVWRGRGAGRTDEPAEPAVTVRRLGAGRVAAVHGDVFAAYHRTRYGRLRRLVGELLDEIWPDRAVDLRSESHVVLNLRESRGRTVVHLLNRGVDPAPSPRNPMVERVPEAAPVRIRLRREARPTSVALVPERAGRLVGWDWADGILSARVERLGVHAALVVE